MCSRIYSCIWIYLQNILKYDKLCSPRSSQRKYFAFHLATYFFLGMFFFLAESTVNLYAYLKIQEPI